MLLYFIVYYAMGWIMAFVLWTITVCKVYRKGYNVFDFADFAHECNIEDYVCEECGEHYTDKYPRLLRAIWGSLIWPIRIFENRHLGQELINMYEKHIEESE